MKLLTIFNCSIQKECGFTDLFVELAMQSKQKSIDLVFIVPKASHDLTVKQIEGCGAKILVVPSPWSANKATRAIEEYIKQEQPDVVNFHFCDTFNFAWLFLKLQFQKIRVVFHYHGEIRPISELKFFNRHFSRLRFINFFTNKIICVSKANRKFLQALNIKRPIDMVYNGLLINKYTFDGVTRDFRKELGFLKNEKIITFMGSLIHRKGIDVLLKAAKIVIEKNPEARFVIVGGGKQEAYILLAEKLGIRDKVFFLGFIDEYPLYVLKSTDLYVSASRAESFGLSIAEAQLLGIPVVATDVGGVPEVVVDRSTGILVPTENSVELAEAIVEIMKDQILYKRMCLEGPNWIKTQFDIKDKVTGILNICF